MRRKFFFVLTMIWMIVIFCFSSRNAEESTKESNAVGMLVGKFVYRDFRSWPKEEEQAFADRWDYPIRKTAHMTEYAVLGFFLAGAAMAEKGHYGKYVFAAFAIAVLYAVSDEIHQYFVPGRACMLTDVGIDSVGAAVGVFVGSAVFWRRSKD